MCGILAMVWRNKSEINETFEKSLQVLEKRGRDSWGLAYGNIESNCEIKIVKASRSIDSRRSKRQIKQNFEKLPEAGWLLMHSRLATNGLSGLDNHNHPISSGDIILIHNGLVTDAHPEFDSHGGSVTDTQYLANLINTYDSGELVNVLNDLRGEINIAWFNRSNQEVCLYSNTGNFHKFTSERVEGFLSEPINEFQIENRIKKKIIVKL